ncbi:MAG: LacI family DNA-binding transcriptional regulator [Anaerorhabdus sp.]
MTNINDVAKRAGVGVSTVSKALNNYSGVSLKTKEKVYKAAKDLNYIPNAVAAALSSKESKRIAIVVFVNNDRQSIDELNMLYLMGSMDKANDLNLEVITVFSNSFINMSKEEVIQYFRSLSISAMVVFGLHKEEVLFHEIMREEFIKCVLVDAPILGDSTSYVMVDHLKAQYDIVKRAVENDQSIKNILYLAGRRDGYVTDLRLQGIKKATTECKVNLKYYYADFSEKMAYDLVSKHLDNSDLIVCASDLMAIGASRSLKKMGKDIAILGYDGISLLGYIDKEITSVTQDFYSLAQMAIAEAKNLIDGAKGSAILVDYDIKSIKYEDVIN